MRKFKNNLLYINFKKSIKILTILNNQSRRTFSINITPINESNNTKIKLINKKFITHDTFIADYESDRKLYIPTGMHISINSNILNPETGKYFSRRYTPISLSEPNSQIIKLLVKIYRPIPNIFPIGGLISQFIDKNLELNIEYPYGKIVYRGDGIFGFRQIIEKKAVNDYNEWPIKKFKRLIMIAGGTGITPLYFILLGILKEQNKNLEINLIYANKSNNDVLLFNEINEMKNKLNLNIRFFIEKLDDKYDNHKDPINFMLGLITKKDLIEFEKYKFDDETMVMICGSKKMVNDYIKPMFEEMNFNKENIFSF